MEKRFPILGNSVRFQGQSAENILFVWSTTQYYLEDAIVIIIQQQIYEGNKNVNKCWKATNHVRRSCRCREERAARSFVFYQRFNDWSPSLRARQASLTRQHSRPPPNPSLPTNQSRRAAAIQLMEMRVCSFVVCVCVRARILRGGGKLKRVLGPPTAGK
ncbi:hypothetical protein PR048_021049 [Dryococelus australis]|uniref:Uncharacterized protein n=1 Tax=Dryococelus australis TaxID=614101 RepID=A0ABQ9GX53_9NEOP|nr:hypothetical protein PR048_021049 [Dryococelus australis]